MSALYAMRYLGGVGIGMGAIYIGKGTIVGVDVAGGRYHGTYTEQGGQLSATGTLSVNEAATLVTGQNIPAGTKIPLSAKLPANFANGQAVSLSVAGNPVQVTFEKIGDIP